MATFVLVHGAWQGAWCWRKMRFLLQAKGHTVFTPTLTGLGERLHLASPDIDLTTHTQDILNVIEYEDLQDIILVGHSYAGMVITGVADQARERIRHLIYLDAFLAENGQNAQEVGGLQIDDAKDGWLVPPLARHIQEANMFGVTDPQEVAWIRPRVSMQPVKTITQRLELSHSDPFPLRSFILSSDSPQSLFPPVAARLKQDPGWHVYTLFGGHNVMMTRPEELADLFHAIG